ncbi:MAG: hypothetical protein FWC55_01890 [Firmicutes bacterium]|nr:hypothetical protein [Bacillota bacterium]
MPVRTKSVELSSIPAIAYKQKLPSGGAGIRIIRLDRAAEAVAALDRRTGDAVPSGKADGALFPAEAFEEAVELTAGLPYAARRGINISVRAEAEPEPEPAPAPESAGAPGRDMSESDEYKAIAERYCDENGKMNYALMNKDFIRFAARSKTVADMVAERALTDDIVIFVVRSRAAHIAGKNDSLGPAETAALIETLDELDPRSVFKELKRYINRLLAV